VLDYFVHIVDSNNMTKLLYLQNMERYSCLAKIIKSGEIDGKQYLVLDQTVFYPQGGGQPSDIGIIRNQYGLFKVEKVVFIDQEIYHFGEIVSGNFANQIEVTTEIDSEKRILNSRIHSAGHVIDLAIQQLYPNLTPSKGYHYPEGPYLEYSIPNSDTTFSIDVDKLNTENSTIISLDLPINFEISNDTHLSGKPQRIMKIIGYPDCPCGGTHVSKLGEIGIITIRKTSNKNGVIRISYNVN